MVDFLETDRPVFYVKAEAKIADYAALLLVADDAADADVNDLLDAVLDLAAGLSELQAMPEGEMRGSETIISYLFNRYGLHALTPLPFSFPKTTVSLCGGSGAPTTGGGAVRWGDILYKPTNLVYGPVRYQDVQNFDARVKALIEQYGNQFVPIALNQVGIHPAFTTNQHELNLYLLARDSGTLPPAPEAVLILDVQGDDGVTITAVAAS